MKQIVVVCNNYREFAYFMETLQWKLSKENKPYKCIRNCIVDIDANIKYIHISCGSDYTFKEQLQGRELNDYILVRILLPIILVMFMMLHTYDLKTNCIPMQQSLLVSHLIQCIG